MNTQATIQAVILAAGKGTRMLPLTEAKPKPMQEVSGKNLLEWKLEALPDEVCDVVMVIGYQGEQIRAYFGDTWKGKRIRYIVQTELNGTAGALWAARELLSGKFLVMMGDDLYGKEDITAMCAYTFAIGGRRVKQKEMKGEILRNPEGLFAGIDETHHYIEEGWMNTGLYMLGQRIFDYAPVLIGDSSTELGLPHTLLALAKDIPVHVVPATQWLQITTPEDLVRAEQEFSARD